MTDTLAIILGGGQGSRLFPLTHTRSKPAVTIPTRPIFTRTRFLPPSEIDTCMLTRVSVAEGCHLTRSTVEESVIGIRAHIREGSHITRSVINGADFYEMTDSASDTVPLGIGRECVLDRVIVDKNARIGDGVRLLNEARVQHADGLGYVIRDGIIIVRNGATVPAGTQA
jgi:glucose-1-phosphate adenylyltransferase